MPPWTGYGRASGNVTRGPGDPTAQTDGEILGRGWCCQGQRAPDPAGQSWRAAETGGEELAPPCHRWWWHLPVATFTSRERVQETKDPSDKPGLSPEDSS